jgi:hypothetical protein
VFRLLVAFTIAWIAWAGWSLLGRSTPFELRVLDDLGSPIASAVVDVNGSQVGTTAEDGRVEVVWTRSTEVLEVSAPGHVSQRLTLSEEPQEQLDVVLKARVLRGRVIDADGEGVEAATVQAGAAHSLTDADGYFQIRGAEEGPVEVTRPAWISTSLTWDGGTGETVVEIEPFTARAVHIDGESMVGEFDRFFDMAMETELNALMIDLKDEDGRVWFDTGNQTAIDVGSVEEVFDLESTVSRAHEQELYVIGRVVLFNDPIAAVSRPDMAVWDAELETPYEARGQTFLDPTDPAARQYGLDLAVEACSMGVDEIQFDYVRFPDARRDSAVFDGGVSPDIRTSTITSFLSQAVETLRPMGCAVAADIFGYLTTAEDDGGIGQRWEEIAATVDVVSPMLYPSHFHPTFFGFPSDEDPGGVVDQALTDGINRLPKKVVVRPWLQDFGYDPALVRDQISAAESHGLGWMLWNAESNVSEEALDPAE